MSSPVQIPIILEIADTDMKSHRFITSAIIGRIEDAKSAETAGLIIERTVQKLLGEVKKAIKDGWKE